MLLALAVFTILLTFDHFPRAKNYEYSYHIMYEEVTVETVSMFTRFMATPLFFMAKFIVKSLMYKGRTIIIKISLIRHVMPKRRLQGFLRRRAEGRSMKSVSRLVSSLSESRVVAN